MLKSLTLSITFAVFIFGCVKGCEGHSPQANSPVTTLTSGIFRETDIRFHPTDARLVALRSIPEEGRSARDTAQSWERRIVEVDFSDPADPSERIIEALDGGSYPSYAGSRGIVALDIRGRLVLLPSQSDTLTEILPEHIPSRPAKPVASPDGRYVAFLAIANPPPDSRPDLNDGVTFRYQAYVVPLEGGEAQRVSTPPDRRSILTALDWADADSLLLTYKVEDPRESYTRIDRVWVKRGEQQLALFTDRQTPIAYAAQATFFMAREGQSPNVLFFDRGMSTRFEQPVGGDILALAIDTTGQRAVASRFAADPPGYSLCLIEIPAALHPEAIR